MSQRDYMEKDYYKALGVRKDATAADINKAYRRIARENHPDVKPGDTAAEARFKEASEAHAVLADATKRKEYDQVRDMVGSGMFSGGNPFARSTGGGGQGFGGFGAEGFDLGDLLGQVLRNGGQRGRAGGGATAGRRGRDLETRLTLSFEDAMAGVTTTLRVQGRTSCATCGGSGAAPGTSPVTCSVCQGAGVIASNQGLFSFSEPCNACNGTGRQIPSPCPTCNGVGAVVRPRDIRARIPAGVKDEARIRLAGKGEAGSLGGPPGDLFVTVHVEEHPVFGRRGDDLTLTAPVTFAEAALGAKIVVPTLGDPVTLKIPSGTESGRTFRVKGRGAPRSNGRPGDLLVTAEVAVPRKLTATQRKALQSFADLDDSDPREMFTPYVRREAAAGS